MSALGLDLDEEHDLSICIFPPGENRANSKIRANQARLAMIAKWKFQLRAWGSFVLQGARASADWIGLTDWSWPCDGLPAFATEWVALPLLYLFSHSQYMARCRLFQWRRSLFRILFSLIIPSLLPIRSPRIVWRHFPLPFLTIISPLPPSFPFLFSKFGQVSTARCSRKGTGVKK